jgi:hypothetical protein
MIDQNTTNWFSHNAKTQSYVPLLNRDDYMNTNPKEHIINATSHISHNHINNYGPPWL